MNNHVHLPQASDLRPGSWLAVNEIFGPTIQGEGVNAGVPAYFVRLNGCDLQCNFCFVPDTPILMSDWTWKRLGDVRVGDSVLAQEREAASGVGGHMRLVMATVERLSSKKAATVCINGTANLRCTPDHKFWEIRTQPHKVGGNRWREVSRCLGSNVRFVAKPPKLESSDFLRGWLAGMADGDGCFWDLRKGGKLYRRFRLAVRDQELLTECDRLLTLLGFSGHYHSTHNAGKNNKFGEPLIPCLYLTRSKEAERLQFFLDNSEREAKNLRSWSRGYLSGVFDAEGSEDPFRISQTKNVNNAVRKRISSCLSRCGFKYTRTPVGFTLHVSDGDRWKFYSLCRPRRKQLLAQSLNRAINNFRMIRSVDPTGLHEEVITLTTSEGSFVAGGFVVKNCDTPQTWKKGFVEPSIRMTAQEILETALKALPVRDPSRHTTLFVVTGGEPLLQQRRPAFRELLEGANAAGYQVEIETAGHHIPERFLSGMGSPVTQWNVSPKLASSGNKFLDYETTLRFYNDTVRCFQRVILKFVVGISDNLEMELSPIDALVKAVDWPESQVVLMPEGCTPDIINAKSAAVIEAAAARGYRFGTRFHTLAWGNKRGV